MSSTEIDNPGGQPSITHPIAGPWDSPNDVKLNSLPCVLPDMEKLAHRPSDQGRRFYHGPAHGSGSGVAQLSAQDLANIGLRQFLTELHPVRHLVRRKASATVRNDIGFAQCRIAPHDEEL